MADDGGAPGGVSVTAVPPTLDSEHNDHDQIHVGSDKSQVQVGNSKLGPSSRRSTFEQLDSGMVTPMAGLKNPKHRELEIDGYFVGPRNMDQHSKLPYFMRMYGSVVPRMILSLFMVGSWATLITCISKFVKPLSVNTVLLTVLGFVVGLSLSFRSSTAYERYSDGRKAWTTLSVQSRNLARLAWVHIGEREGEAGKDDLLGKITAINLLLAFAVSLKHHLRFEPYAHYQDIADLIGHLDTFAQAAYEPAVEEAPHISPWKRLGNHLGVSFAESNPRKAIKRANRPLGNLPLEILTYLSSYFESQAQNGNLKSPVVLGAILASIGILTDTMSSAERVLTTPLPIGYNILISQIVLLYVWLLPFQLVGVLGWITIPGTVAAAYIIIGMAAIGNELENPFGDDVNDLPLDFYCEELRKELDILTSSPPVKFEDMIKNAKAGQNKVLWPLSHSGTAEWRTRSTNDIRSALKAKVVATAEPVSSKASTLRSRSR